MDTRLTTVESAGFVSASGLSGYNFATEGYVQTALDDYVAVDGFKGHVRFEQEDAGEPRDD